MLATKRDGKQPLLVALSGSLGADEAGLLRIAGKMKVCVVSHEKRTLQDRVLLDRSCY